jgi:pyrroline-5-carboxylate reductase
MNRISKEEKFFKITIVGGGKLGQRIAKGISIYIPKFIGLKTDITVLRVSDRLKDDKANLLLKIPRVSVTTESGDILNSNIVILAVNPTKDATCSMFKKIIPVIKNTKVPVISFVSGLSIGAALEAFGRDIRESSHGFVKATCNTNFDTSYGIVYAAVKDGDIKAGRALDFISKISKVRKTESANISKYIAAVGSMNAYDCEYLFRLYTEAEIPDSQLPVLLNELLLKAFNWYARINNMETHSVDSWLYSKFIGFKQIGIPESEAIFLAQATFVSTIQSLLSDLRDGEVLMKRLESVPTKGGCTENQLNYLAKLSSSNEMRRNIPSVIRETFISAKKIKVNLPDFSVEKKVFAGINRGNFPE